MLMRMEGPSFLFCGYRIKAITPAFQAGDASSILAIRSKLPFRLMAGHVVLVHSVEVRVLQGQQ